jgi:hypothetical protein
LAAELVANGAPPERVLSHEPDVAIEDLVNPDVYLTTVRDLLIDGGTQTLPTHDDLAGTGTISARSDSRVYDAVCAARSWAPHGLPRGASSPATLTPPGSPWPPQDRRDPGRSAFGAAHSKEGEEPTHEGLPRQGSPAGTRVGAAHRSALRDRGPRHPCQPRRHLGTIFVSSAWYHQVCDQHKQLWTDRSCRPSTPKRCIPATSDVPVFKLHASNGDAA